MKERALLIGVRRPRATAAQMDASLEELGRLVDTAGAEVVKVIKQELHIINPAIFIGKGKSEEIADEIKGSGIDLVVVDDELTPAQNRNLGDIFGIKVLDRTAIILDIFAKRAHTKEGKLQVELAQLNYLLPRLVGRGLALSQQAGYIGTRGPGETKLEVDKRRIKERMSFLRKGLLSVRSHRDIHRSKRASVPIPVVALVGYTNAGKSTLMNAMTKAGVFVEDKLFATLDPTIRKMRLAKGREILIADTVGFIRKLPHQLVESFKATFEEVGQAEILLHIIDASDPEAEHQIEVVESVLKELDLITKPRVRVYNKCDAGHLYMRTMSDGVQISALTGDGLDKLSERVSVVLADKFKRTRLKLPLDAGGVLSEIYRIGSVVRARHYSKCISVDALLPEKLLKKYEKYVR